MQDKAVSLMQSVPTTSRIQEYVLLTQFRLSSLVVFSAAMGFIIASGPGFSWSQLLLLTLGGFLVTGSSNGFNQVIEKDLDKIMDRTAERPLPSGRLSVQEAMAVSMLMGISGVLILWFTINPLSGFLSLFSLFIYTLIYTPAKKFTPFAVLIGAIPGAVPPLLGWVAAKNEIGLEALLLYAIQFIWQFPHFWAIAWVLHDDYLKAGFRMLPSAGGRNRMSAFQTLAYSICLIPLGMLPYFFGFVSIYTSLIIILSGLLFTAPAFYLYRDCDMRSAQKLMFASFIYLPLIQLAWMIDKLF
ncbi:MAG: protoheme IX farnesyltransferase [Bacteroidetes bacterium]|nr:MAG: protoheme IX farnesyltransferase [Bacteroidota bacterium]